MKRKKYISISADAGLVNCQAKHSEENSPEVEESLHNRRRGGLKRVVSSSPRHESLSPVQEAVNCSSESSGVEIRETQNLSFFPSRIEVHVPAPAALLNREEYTCLPFSITSSQNTSSDSYYLASNKETDNDSAVSLASPISEAPFRLGDSLGARNSSRHNIQTINSDLDTGKPHPPDKTISPITELDDAIPGTPQSALFCPEFRAPREQSPSILSESEHSSNQFSSFQDPPITTRSNHISKSLKSNTQSHPSTIKRLEALQTQAASFNRSQPLLRLSCGESGFCRSTKFYSRVSSSSSDESVNLNLDFNLEDAEMDMSKASTQSPTQSPSSIKPSFLSLREKIALARTPSRTSIEPSSPQRAIMLSPSIAATSTSLPASQSILTGHSTTTVSPSAAQTIENAPDEVLPTTELPSQSQIEPLLSSAYEPSNSLPRNPSLFRTSPWNTKSDPFGRCLLTPPMYAVTLPATGHMRHRYREWFREKDLRLLSRFLQEPSESCTNDRLSLLGKIENFLEQLHMATLHPDFNADPRVYESMTQTVPEPSQEARWADLTSTKFAFIGKLFDELQTGSHQIAIVAKSSQSINTLETYLRSKRVPVRCIKQNLDLTFNHTTAAACHVVLIASGERSREAMKDPNLKAEMVIDFDGSTKPENSYLQTLDPSTPIVHLIVVNSLEHIKKFLSEELSPRERLRCQIIAATHLRKHMGILPQQNQSESEVEARTQTNFKAIEDIPDSQCRESQAVTARLVAQALRSEDFHRNWPLSPLPKLDFGKIEATASLLNVHGERLASVSESRVGTPSGLKRMREQDSMPPISKRLRATPMQDVTHISDSLKDPQSQLESLHSTLKACESALASERSEKNKLREYLEEKEARLEDMTVSLSRLQHRYETRTNDFHRLRREKAILESDRLASNNKKERVSTENLSLRDERRQLQEQLQTARTDLKEGGGTTADLEAMREAHNKLEKERDSLLKSNENIRKDFEFTRQQYQLASSTAADLASQLSEKEAENAKLAKQASDEKRRLRELNTIEHEKQHRAAVIRLEEQVASMEKLLIKKEDELERARRGRGVQTRAGSAQPQPGSPRLVGRSGDSRGASPIPGMVDTRHVYGGAVLGAGGGRTSALRREG